MSFYLFCIVGYLVGSIPFGYLLTKFYNDLDLREFGSNSTGATNVLRSGNKKLAFLTLLLDLIKGSIFTLCCVFFANELTLYAASFCCLIGHVYPIWLGFKGGKGAATTAGIFLVLSPIPALISIKIWLLLIKFVKISSIASLSLGLSLFLINFYKFLKDGTNLKVLLFSLLVFLFLIYTHIENIKRMTKKEEKPTL